MKPIIEAKPMTSSWRSGGLGKFNAALFDPAAYENPPANYVESLPPGVDVPTADYNNVPANYVELDPPLVSLPAGMTSTASGSFFSDWWAHVKALQPLALLGAAGVVVGGVVAVKMVRGKRLKTAVREVVPVPVHGLLGLRRKRRRKAYRR